MKVPALVPVPDPLVIDIVPVVVPAAGVAVIDVLLFTTKDAAAKPLNFTTVDPVKLFPVMLTAERLPAHPEVGVKVMPDGLAAFAVAVVISNTINKTARTMTGTVLVCIIGYNFLISKWGFLFYTVQHSTCFIQACYKVTHISFLSYFSTKSSLSIGHEIF